MARRQDPHLLIIATSCWKRSPGVAAPRPKSLAEEHCWENPSAQPEARVDAGRGSRERGGRAVSLREEGEHQAFAFLLL